MSVPILAFPALAGLENVRHAFTLRVPGLDVQTDRETALRRLDQFHAQAREELLGGAAPFITARQVHGNKVATVQEDAEACFEETDGLITNLNKVCLGIYVADCCAVYLVDPVNRAIGLLHSGKKGTELAIVPRALDAMHAAFGSDPREMIVQLSPCIRPPEYEIDFAARISAQCRECGVQQVFDSALNTGADLGRFYSYRIEKGRTGRMLAMLALDF